MKKIFLLLLLAAFTLSSHAQKGMQGIGVNVGVNYNFDRELSPTTFGADIKYQYNFWRLGRIEPFLSVAFGEATEFMVGVNYHQFFYEERRVRLYFLAGVAYGKIGVDCCEKVGETPHRLYGEYYRKRYYNTYTSTPFEWDGGTIPVYEDFVGSGQVFSTRAGLGFDVRLTHKLSLQTEVMFTLNSGQNGHKEYWGHYYEYGEKANGAWFYGDGDGCQYYCSYYEKALDGEQEYWRYDNPSARPSHDCRLHSFYSGSLSSMLQAKIGVTYNF